MSNDICVPELAIWAGQGYRAAVGKELAQKITLLRRSLGDNQAEFAARFGVTQGSVSRWENGAMPDPVLISQLADLAGEDVRSFLGANQSDAAFVQLGQRFMIKGAVAAGVWREALEWPEDDWTPYTGGAHVSVEPSKRFGLRVEGDSMNEIYPPGTVLDCVNVYDAADIESGRNVIVIRRRVDDTIEATVKQYVVDENGRQWLVPRSYNPAFRNAMPMDQQEPDIAEVSIIGLVVGSYRPE